MATAFCCPTGRAASRKFQPRAKPGTQLDSRRYRRAVPHHAVEHQAFRGIIVPKGPYLRAIRRRQQRLTVRNELVD
jgi:hypothetical protein